MDEDDYKWISSRKWSPSDNGSGLIYFHSGKGGKKVALHRQIARARFCETVDHINGNTLDNRKQNLRRCTTAQNTWNQTAHKRGNAFYKGVHKVNGRFKAMITANNVTYNLGTYDDVLDAAKARDAAAMHLHGEFAYLNLPLGTVAPKEPVKPRKYNRGR